MTTKQVELMLKVVELTAVIIFGILGIVITLIKL